MNRKILRIGPATLAVSLPMKWVRKFGLKKGEEIEVEEQGSIIRVGARKGVEKEGAIVDVGSLGSMAPKVIGMLYKAGYRKIKAIYSLNNEIIYKGKKTSEINVVKDTLDYLNGMQLWEIGNSRKDNIITSLESSKVNPKEFDNVLAKLYLHLIAQGEQVRDFLFYNTKILDEIYLTERLINQSADFCIRILVVYGHERYDKSFQFYDIVTKLESTADKYLQIAIEFQKEKKVNKEIKIFIEKTIEFISQLNSLYLKFKYEKLIDLTKNVEKAISDYEREFKSKGNLINYNLYSLLIDIYEIVEKLYFLNSEYFKDD